MDNFPFRLACRFLFLCFKNSGLARDDFNLITGCLCYVIYGWKVSILLLFFFILVQTTLCRRKREFSLVKFSFVLNKLKKKGKIVRGTNMAALLRRGSIWRHALFTKLRLDPLTLCTRPSWIGNGVGDVDPSPTHRVLNTNLSKN